MFEIHVRDALPTIQVPSLTDDDLHSDYRLALVVSTHHVQCAGRSRSSCPQSAIVDAQLRLIVVILTASPRHTSQADAEYMADSSISFAYSRAAGTLIMLRVTIYRLSPSFRDMPNLQNAFPFEYPKSAQDVISVNLAATARKVDFLPPSGNVKSHSLRPPRLPLTSSPATSSDLNASARSSTLLALPPASDSAVCSGPCSSPCYLP